MGITNTLVGLAVATALAPVLALRLRRPARIRDLLLAALVGIATLVIGAALVQRRYPLRLYELMHLAYLLVVVSVPILLGTWFVVSVLRSDRSRLTDLAGVAAVVVAFLGIWGTHIEPNWLRVDRATVTADIAAPLTIGVLSDLQTPNVGDIEWEAVERLIAEQPDMVVVPGDLFQGEWHVIEENRSDFVALLTALVDSVELVAVVSGDSDSTGQLEPIVNDAGALYIDNLITEVVVAGQPVRLVGVAVGASQPKRDTIAALGTATDMLTVLVSHRPGITYSLPPNSDIDLIVAGHTHGGQIRLPIVSRYLWYSDVPARISAGGFHVLNDFGLYVSTGVGLERHASPQVRFGVRPEVGIITIVPEGS